jgi:hypothetical protein
VLTKSDIKTDGGSTMKDELLAEGGDRDVDTNDLPETRCAVVPIMTNSSNLELNSGSDKGVDDKVLFGRE